MIHIVEKAKTPLTESIITTDIANLMYKFFEGYKERIEGQAQRGSVNWGTEGSSLGRFFAQNVFRNLKDITPSGSGTVAPSNVDFFMRAVLFAVKEELGKV